MSYKRIRLLKALLEKTRSGQIGQVICCWVVSVTWAIQASDAAERIDFNRDVRPLLVENCFKCHGPDAASRKAGLRLDEKEPAMSRIDSGGFAIVPGDVVRSLLVKRVSADDESRMPPPSSHKSLTVEQVGTLTRWIAAGADWPVHWSFALPRRTALPAVVDPSWPRTPIDRFILARLEDAGLEPSDQASPRTLLRRLNFDLLGLPPHEKVVAEFLEDQQPHAYERHVDRLLQSPSFGERMAVFWLDLVRFGDTRGYHSDNTRNVTPYRDYVINAFNANKPYDRFTIEQLAGDLLPNPSIWQQVASCYNKLNQTTEEGGAQAAEYAAIYAADRIRNTCVVWMAATMGCAECHDHKYDPYRTRDFYRFGAFFADIQEKIVGSPEQGIPVPSFDQSQRLEELVAIIARSEQELSAVTPELLAAQKSWETEVLRTAAPQSSNWQVLGPVPVESARSAHEQVLGIEERFQKDGAIDLTDRDKEYPELTWRQRTDLVDGEPHELNFKNSATIFYRTIEVIDSGRYVVHLNTHGGATLWLNGQKLHADLKIDDTESEPAEFVLPLVQGTNHLLLKVATGASKTHFYFVHSGGDWPPGFVREILAVSENGRDGEQRHKLRNHFRSTSPLLEHVRLKLTKSRREKEEILAAARYCLVSVSGNPRTVRVLPRGNWLDTSGEIVEPAIPDCFGSLNVEGRRATRLDLAKWLVSFENPLTARAFVNRIWKMFFGRGLSSGLDDLGAMGESPVHAELLDWLAVEFMESGWDVKHLVRLMVTSSVYQQKSLETRELRSLDPSNRLLARQSRWRLDAEFVRDNALEVSGLLSHRLGGPSVKPYQPAGYWANLNFPVRKWEADALPGCHRRGVYTWWQRSYMHPALMVFDAPSRQECTAERPRSNIPQQALVLLNDPTHVEAARVLAQSILREGGKTPQQRIGWMCRRVLTREPVPYELQKLEEVYLRHREQYAMNPQEAEQLIAIGEVSSPADLDVVELAAWSSVARIVLNLHEVVIRN